MIKNFSYIKISSQLIH